MKAPILFKHMPVVDLASAGANTYLAAVSPILGDDTPIYVYRLAGAVTSDDVEAAQERAELVAEERVRSTVGVDAPVRAARRLLAGILADAENRGEIVERAGYELEHAIADAAVRDVLGQIVLGGGHLSADDLERSHLHRDRQRVAFGADPVDELGALVYGDAEPPDTVAAVGSLGGMQGYRSILAVAPLSARRLARGGKPLSRDRRMRIAAALVLRAGRLLALARRIAGDDLDVKSVRVNADVRD